ncbi:MAG TPA: EAL domain-containing protein [Burkholderiales bacterium]|nr:EAL domain-containing protein [Burkholderiales bacterium]
MPTQEPRAARQAVSRLAGMLARLHGIETAVVAVSLAIIGALWWAAVFQSDRERQQVIDAAMRQNSNLVIAFEEQTVRTIRDVEEALLLLGREYERSGKAVDIAGLIEDGLIDGRLFTNIVVVDEHGDLVVSSQALVPLNIADREYFKAHAADPGPELKIGKPLVSRSYQNAAIPMSRRIDKPDGRFGGVVSALVDPRYFLHFYEKANIGEQGLIHLVGLDGIARARRAGNVATVGVDMSGSTLIKAARVANSGSFITAGRVEGVPRLQSFRRIGEYPLIVAVATSEAEVLAPTIRNRRNYFVAAGALSFVVVLFAALLLAAVSRRNRALVALSASETQFRATFEQAAIGIAHTTLEDRFLRVNEKLCSMVGYSREELLGMSMHDLSHPDEVGKGAVNRKRLIAGEIDTISAERRCVCKDGSIKWLHRTISMVRDPGGEPAYFIRVAEDITERKRLEHALQHTATHDKLTDLPNRSLIHDRLRHALEQATRRERAVGVMFIDLDRFKIVNDTLGHAMGDRLLQTVAERLKACVRGEDTVGRLGGDEFAIVLTELASAGDAEVVAQKVLDALSGTLDLDGHEAYVTASIGIATYPLDGADADSLIRNADVAMYRAKAAGKNTFQLYSRALDGQAAARLEMENRLRYAIPRSELVLHFQPKADVRTGAVTGVEALLRWRMSADTLVPPAKFIPLLEDTGLIVPVGEWVLRAACSQLREWADAGIGDVPIAVNLSAVQLRHENITDVVRRALDDHGVPAHLLELEITESAAMENPEAAAAALRTLKALGVRIAIDDFGTGYSSLAYLKRFPIDAVKLDRAFTTGVTEDAEDASIAEAVITLSHALGLIVVAEGVETADQAAFLGHRGCDEMQGYYVARPMPADACTYMLAQSRKLAAVA